MFTILTVLISQYVHIKSLSCTPETNTLLLVSYTSIEKKKKNYLFGVVLGSNIHGSSEALVKYIVLTTDFLWRPTVLASIPIWFSFESIHSWQSPMRPWPSHLIPLPDMKKLLSELKEVTHKILLKVSYIHIYIVFYFKTALSIYISLAFSREHCT